MLLLAYPIQKRIDYSYWRKQELQQQYIRLYDRKINLIDEFNTTLNMYLLCSKQDSSDSLNCYRSNKARLRSLVLQIKLYFGSKLSTDINDFEAKVSKYEENILTFEQEQQYTELLNIGEKLTQKMYDNLVE